jgi:hypothetical protein
MSMTAKPDETRFTPKQQELFEILMRYEVSKADMFALVNMVHNKRTWKDPLFNVGDTVFIQTNDYIDGWFSCYSQQRWHKGKITKGDLRDLRELRELRELRHDSTTWHYTISYEKDGVSGYCVNRTEEELLADHVPTNKP